MTQPDGAAVVVIGAGLVGLATARAILALAPGTRVVVIEKEAGIAMHQSTHNSGVLHCGLYYKPGSAKARLAVSGIREMIAFCEAEGVAFERCGKLVVATTDEEVARLRDLAARGTANGLQGLRWLDGAAAREIEPEVRALAALHVPEEGIVDYAGVAAAIARGLVAAGAEIRTGTAVTGLRRDGRRWVVETTTGHVAADHVVNCAGLHSDRIAAMTGHARTVRIVPFRGEYFLLRPERSALVRHLIYPVPDPQFPFLGVHFTRMIAGGVECGPNAVLALHREGYRWRDVRVRDAVDALGFPGLWRFLRRYPSMVGYEVRRSLDRAEFCRSLQRLVPAVQPEDLLPGGAGVRAQAMRDDGSLVEDFVVEHAPGVTHVVNAPSPAATASLAIGREIATQVAATGALPAAARAPGR
jgi:L-2-hydroxyglutarate oxidase